MFNVHGRLKSENVEDGYVQDNVNAKFLVFLNLAI